MAAINKWYKRFMVEPVGTVRIEGREVQLVAFAFEVKGDKYWYAWSLCIPEYMLVYKQHTYTKSGIQSKAKWYTQGLRGVEDWTNIQGL